MAPDIKFFACKPEATDQGIAITAKNFKEGAIVCSKQISSSPALACMFDDYLWKSYVYRITFSNVKYQDLCATINPSKKSYQ